MENKILSQGAEAVLELKGGKVIKRRIKKSYRLKELDERIRKLRTRGESKILEKASKLISVPKVIKSDEKTKEIEMEFIPGRVLSNFIGEMSEKEQSLVCEEIGEEISKLHKANIIHGDLTPSNMIISNKDKKIYFIDFGLSYISPKIEDKAVDLHLLREALEAGFAERWKALLDAVKKGYSKNNKDSKRILERFTAVERRGRYKRSS